MKTILQVEDDPNDVLFLHKAMKKVGVTNPIQVASDGREAIDYLQGAGKFTDRGKYPFPCLVLLDLKLPYVMGLEVLKWIRKGCGAALRVVMLSASAQDEDIASSYRLGANAFLSKPSEARQLEEMVKAIKDFWLTHNSVCQETRIEEMVSLDSLRSLGHALPGRSWSNSLAAPDEKMTSCGSKPKPGLRTYRPSSKRTPQDYASEKTRAYKTTNAGENAQRNPRRANPMQEIHASVSEGPGTARSRYGYGPFWSRARPVLFGRVLIYQTWASDKIAP